MSERRTFSRDYKLAAVKKVIEQGLSFAQVARDLGIRDTLIHSWRKAFEQDGTLQNEVTQSTSVEAELKRLRAENKHPSFTHKNVNAGWRQRRQHSKLPLLVSPEKSTLQITQSTKQTHCQFFLGNTTFSLL